MRPFDINKAKVGEAVCTRDGNPVRILCYDAKGDYPIIALRDINNREFISRHTRGGFVSDVHGSPGDLMMASDTKKGWVHIMRLPEGKGYEPVGVFETKEEAMAGTTTSAKEYITTIQIEWEE